MRFCASLGLISVQITQTSRDHALLFFIRLSNSKAILSVEISYPPCPKSLPFFEAGLRSSKLVAIHSCWSLRVKKNTVGKIQLLCFLTLSVFLLKVFFRWESTLIFSILWLRCGRRATQALSLVKLSRQFSEPKVVVSWNYFGDPSIELLFYCF